MLGSFTKCRSLIRLVRHDIFGVNLPAKYYLWIGYPSPIITADNQDVLGRIIIGGRLNKRSANQALVTSYRPKLTLSLLAIAKPTALGGTYGKRKPLLWLITTF